MKKLFLCGMSVMAFLSASPLMTSCDKNDDNDDNGNKNVIKADFDTADYRQTDKVVFYSDTFQLPCKVWVLKENQVSTIMSYLYEYFYVENKDLDNVSNYLFDQTGKLSEFGNFQDGYYLDSTKRYGVTPLSDLITASTKGDRSWFYVGHREGYPILSGVSIYARQNYHQVSFTEASFPVCPNGTIGAPRLVDPLFRNEN